MIEKITIVMDDGSERYLRVPTEYAFDDKHVYPKRPQTERRLGGQAVSTPPKQAEPGPDPEHESD